MDPLANIRAILSSSPARQPDRGVEVWDLNTGPWWKLFTDWNGLERAKHHLLAAVWALPGPLYFLPPEPIAPELEPFPMQDVSGSWRLNRGRAAEEFYGVELNEGNWSLYAAERPAETALPNTFKTSPRTLTKVMQGHGITVLIDSFYDDTEWRIAIAGS
jgi:hypothetical protein